MCLLSIAHFSKQGNKSPPIHRVIREIDAMKVLRETQKVKLDNT